MRAYLDLLKDIMMNGITSGDRTGTGTISVFGRQLRFDLSKGFPLLTTKKVHMRSIIHENLWFLKGDTNIKYLKDNNVTIWDEWADNDGNIGSMYGKLWVNWPDYKNGKSINQIEALVEGLKTRPNSRRHIVTAWNPADLPDESISPVENVLNGKPALTTCHNFFQCYVRENRLSLMLNLRSSDSFLGLPFNIAGYALLTHMLAQQCDMEVGDLVINIGDSHIYLNHVLQVNEQLDRVPKELPQLVINRKPSSIFDYEFDDFTIINYDSYPAIKADISI